MGMNTGQIFQAGYQKQRQLRETQHQGWTRIEISYYAHSVAEEEKFWEPDFLVEAEYDILQTLKVLNQTPGVCYRIPMYSILQCWQDGMKKNQVFVL